MKKLIVCLVILVPVISVQSNLKAAILTAVNSGTWNNPTIWDIGRTPICGDTILIPSSYLVSITDNVNLNDPTDPLCPAVRISVSGQVDFARGKKIRLVDGACITVEWGGSMHPSETGGGRSEAVIIGNDTWWQSSNGVLNGLAAMGCVSPLPVESVYLEIKEEEVLKLIWNGLEDENIDFYVLEKSKDGYSWEIIAMIAASGHDRAYETEDSKSIETQYYRLKSINNDGLMNVLGTQVYLPSIQFGADKLMVLPNVLQAESVLALSFDFDSKGETTINFCNQLGQVVHSEIRNLEMNQHSLTLDRPSLGTGNYIIVMKNNEKLLTGKLVIL